MSQTLTVDADTVQEIFFARGWTDGLPIVPPTPSRVAEMLAVAGLPGRAVLGRIAARGAGLTAETVATNAVMAGCRPDYFPVLLAAIEAMLDPAFNANAALTSTGGAALCVIVSGPIAAEVGINSGHNALGPGYRANATIGRALRLVAINAFDARPGRMDGSSLGNPGKYSLCFAESPPPPGWPPVRVQLGYDEADTTVTLLASEAPRQIANHLNPDAAGILATFASAMRSPSSFTCGKGGQAVIVVGPEHAASLASAGLSPYDVRGRLVENSRVTLEELVGAGIVIPRDGQHRMNPEADGRLPAVRDIDDLLVVTAGGAGAGWSAYLPSWATTVATRMVTRRVRPAGEADPSCGTDVCEVPRGVW